MGFIEEFKRRSKVEFAEMQKKEKEKQQEKLRLDERDRKYPELLRLKEQAITDSLIPEILMGLEKADEAARVERLTGFRGFYWLDYSYGGTKWNIIEIYGEENGTVMINGKRLNKKEALNSELVNEAFTNAHNSPHITYESSTEYYSRNSYKGGE